MKRSQISTFLYFRNDIIVYELAAEEFLAAMYHTVSHSLDILKGSEGSVFLVEKGVKDSLYAHGMVRDRHFPDIFFFSGCLVLDAAGFHSDSFHKAFRQEVEHFIAFHIQKLVLQGRTSTIQN